MSDYYRINYLIFMKPRLPGLVPSLLFFLKLTLMVRLGMQIAWNARVASQ